MGTGVGLWKAVKLAKDITTGDLPTHLTLNGEPIAGGDAANSFAKYFNDKVKLNKGKTHVNPNIVYNGKCKQIVQDINFMK